MDWRGSQALRLYEDNEGRVGWVSPFFVAILRLFRVFRHGLNSGVLQCCVSYKREGSSENHWELFNLSGFLLEFEIY